MLMAINIYPYFHLAVRCVYARYTRKALAYSKQSRHLYHSKYIFLFLPSASDATLSALHDTTSRRCCNHYF